MIHHELYRVVKENIDKINAKLDYSRDFNYDFFGFKTLERSYLLKIDNRKEQVGTDGETGSGFGLLLCEDFVQRHGGRLSWESAPQQGSTFRFTVPELIG